MIEKGKDTSICCNYCGWKVPVDFLQIIKENAGSLFCEFCGIEIELDINKSSEKDNRENLKSSNKPNVSGNNNLKKSSKPSVRLIIKDEDFPRIFKENLIIVISRLIYIYIRIWENETNTSANRETITKSSFYELACKIKPIIDSKISHNFLLNLNKIDIAEFEDWLKLLQKKLHSDEAYLNHFKCFLLWLIKIVIKLMSEMWEMKNIPIFHSTILKDLKNYNFSFAAIEEDIRVGTDDITAKNNIINISDLRQKISIEINSLIKKADGIKDQKENLLLKSREILEKHIERAENNEFTITKNANFKVIAATIIFTVLVSNNNIPKINIAQLSGIAYSSISRYYTRYFKELYPKIDSRITSLYGFSKIKNIISLYFFNLIKNGDMKTHELVLNLKRNFKLALIKQLSKREMTLLNDLSIQKEDIFIQYFSELVVVVKELVISSRMNKKINARFTVKYLAEYLYNKEISLLQDFDGFYSSIIEIFDFLKKKFPNSFPSRTLSLKGLSKKAKNKKIIDYRRVVGSRIKIYIIKHIYRGLYLRNGKLKCPSCAKEGLYINTDISRLNALDFHHFGEKEDTYSASELFRKFSENQSNPHFLEDLIDKMESEKVKLLCKNHHSLETYKYFNYFNHLIMWDKIFSYSPELIHVLIRISVDNHRDTKNLPAISKDLIRLEIAYLLKKRYIIEYFYGDYCHTCGEFSTRKYLNAFHFNHIHEDKKTVTFTKLSKYLSCSEIIRILDEQEGGGGFICANCHEIIHFDKHVHLLNQIYEDKNIIKKVLEDRNRVLQKFTPIHKSSEIKDPLKQSMRISDSFEKYLTAIYRVSKSGCLVTNKALASELSLLVYGVISRFFKRNKVVMKQYVEIDKTKRPTVYTLTNKGVEVISLIQYFKEYYNSN